MNAIGMYAIALPDELETDPVAVDGTNKWTLPLKAGGIP